jgi:glyoxylase-like metal-dependent hydrolase (beta-lactamase superfamily II)
MGSAEGFSPDICLQDGDSLSTFGLDARVIHLPGHSSGSIAVLTVGGDLFCGDLFVNVKKPARNSILADKAAYEASIKRVTEYEVKLVFPGHGRPFVMEEIKGLGGQGRT